MAADLETSTKAVLLEQLLQAITHTPGWPNEHRPTGAERQAGGEAAIDLSAEYPHGQALRAIVTSWPGRITRETRSSLTAVHHGTAGSADSWTLTLALTPDTRAACAGVAVAALCEAKEHLAAAGAGTPAALAAVTAMLSEPNSYNVLSRIETGAHDVLAGPGMFGSAIAVSPAAQTLAALLEDVTPDGNSMTAVSAVRSALAVHPDLVAVAAALAAPEKGHTLPGARSPRPAARTRNVTRDRYRAR
jgi:hypothetical protein